jgi:hypothetical protein
MIAVTHEERLDELRCVLGKLPRKCPMARLPRLQVDRNRAPKTATAVSERWPSPYTALSYAAGTKV